MGKTVFQLSPDGGTTKYDLRDSNIAPIELDSAHASQPYAVKEEFVLDADGLLYEATSPISQNDAFIVYPTSGYNCKLSDSVTGQIRAIKDSLGTASNKNAISVVTDSSDLVESGAVKDIIGWGNKNKAEKIVVDNHKESNFTVLYIDGDLQPNTVYKLQFSNDNGNVYYTNQYLFTSEIDVTADGTKILTLTTKSTVSKSDTTQYENGYGYKILKNRNAQSEFPVFSNVMLYDADIVDDTYEPYHASVEEYCASKQDVIDTVGWCSTVLDKGVIASANVNNNGTINNSTYSLAYFKVQAGKKYTVSNCNDFTDSNLVLAYFTDVPVLMAVSYNNSRTLIDRGTATSQTVTAPIDGYIAIRMNNTTNNIRFEEGEFVTQSVEDKKCDNSVIAPTENSSTASKDYAVGDYFIKDAILGKTKAAIASGGTFTKDTNYEETNIAKELTELYKYIGILTTPVEAFTANSLPILKRNITNAFYNGSLRAEIAAGNFKNVRPGDYIIGQATGSIYYVVECDYWLGNGDSTNGTTYPAYNTHHLGLMLFKPVGTTALWRGYGYSDKSWRVSASDLGRCPWNADTTVDPTDTEAIGSNSTNITRSYNGTNMSAYMGSFIRERIDAILLPQCFQADFGSENVLKRRNWLSNAINTSLVSGGRGDWQGIAIGSVWVDRFIDLPSEVELYGSIINSSSRDDVGIQNKQLPIFRNGRIHDFYPRMDVWTKAVASSLYACIRNINGNAAAGNTSSANWASPLACVR